MPPYSNQPVLGCSLPCLFPLPPSLTLGLQMKSRSGLSLPPDALVLPPGPVWPCASGQKRATVKFLLVALSSPSGHSVTFIFKSQTQIHRPGGKGEVPETRKKRLFRKEVRAVRAGCCQEPSEVTSRRHSFWPPSAQRG